MRICTSHVPLWLVCFVFRSNRKDNAVRCSFMSEMQIGLVWSCNDEATRHGKPSHRHPKSRPGDSFVTQYHVVRGRIWRFRGVQIAVKARHRGKRRYHNPACVQTGAKKMLREYRNRLAYWSGVRLVSVAAAGAGTRGRLSSGITGDYQVSAPQVTPLQVLSFSAQPQSVSTIGLRTHSNGRMPKWKC